MVVLLNNTCINEKKLEKNTCRKKNKEENLREGKIQLPC